MNFDLRALLEQILKAPARTKLVALLSVAALVAAISVGGWVAGRPHFVKLYSELSDLERVAVEKALAGEAIRYRVSDFPGPFVVYVDESQYDQAQIAVALAEALKASPKGIDSGAAGASTIFLSAGERNQTMQKREWQEAERLLEQLDFVADATVTTSMPDASPLRQKKPVMVSVALRLKGSGSLAEDQATNVAKLVMYRFGVPKENVVITDQSGHTLYDPTGSDDEGVQARELLDRAAKYDRDLAAKANQHIEAAFGARKALVSVTSQWNYDQSTTLDEKVDPKAVAVEVDTKTTQTPAGSQSNVGGPAGISSSLPNEFGNESAAVPTAASNSNAPLATTKDEKKVFETSKTRTQTVRNVPKLERLSVALVIDESLAAKRDEIQRIVEAAVGFDSMRQDVIGVSTTTFSAPAEASEPEGGAAVEEEGLSPTVEMLLRRGVEIVSALGFLFLLITSIKGGKKSKAAVASSAPSSTASVAAVASSGGADAASAPSEAEIDPDMLARAQIEELVRTDPRRVGEILSRWADDKSPARAG